MNFLNSILIGVSLSLDCFAISISQGLRKNSNHVKAILILSFLFALFQSGMLVIGYFAGSFSSGFLGNLTTWISALLLFFIGGKMLKEAFEVESDDEENVNNFRDYMVLSISTSIDALAAGFALTTLNVNWIVTTICVGIVCFILSMAGGFFGRLIGEKFGKRSEIFGGLILIGLGISVLVK